ncbi:MAG TPA: SusD/RagB family nutrient-binding outer membrane lipoprotein [Puia sp.]|nr:SusD/RagB family nutrient-binding outer membrane lipoprotein [Puia sp.]
MLKRIKTYFAVSALLGLLTTAGCKKGTFDINEVSPNSPSPSTVSSKFLLSSALSATAYSQYYTGFLEFSNLFMGYYAFSGDYGGYGTTATYELTNSQYVGNWDYVYQNCLVNYQEILENSRTPEEANYFGMAQIMEAFHYERLVDIYNNIPYSEALKGTNTSAPKFDDAATVYAGIIKQVDSGIAAIQGASTNADNPGSYDVLFGGNMSQWVLFGNTVKLRILLNLTQTSSGPATIQSELSGLTTDNFLPAGTDAAVNPGYSNANQYQQNPFWEGVGFTTAGSDYGDHDFYRANAYAVNFYQAHNDARDSFFYADNLAGVVHGRVFGSQDGTEHNTVISAIGSGVLQSYAQSAPLIPSFESLFFQAEAVQRGYLAAGSGYTNGVVDIYDSAVSQSFRLLGIPNSATAAQAYYTQSDPTTNYSMAGNPINFLIMQEWAANNMYDPLTSWNNWRRLGIPSDLPVSIYPGTTAPHVPYRLPYDENETTTNGANVNAQGTINIITSKIFWMP